MLIAKKALQLISQLGREKLLRGEEESWDSAPSNLTDRGGSRPISEGKVKKVKMAPVKIYSRLFNEEIYVVADQEEMEALGSRGVKEVIYIAWEIPVLRGKGKAHLAAVHQTKKLFPGAGLA